MPRAAVITPFFVDRDAVCNDVFHSARALRARGWEVRIFAVGGHSEREQAQPIEALAGFIREPGDLAYLHFSTGRRDVMAAVAALPGRKALKFHNVTPPELFSMWSDELAEASRLGRADIAATAAHPWDVALGDSSFNLAEIEPWLAPSTVRGVVPPFHETQALLAARPTAAEAARPPRLLSVGRLAQSKGHPFLLRVMRYLVHELGVDAGLDIVGKPDHRLLAYRQSLALMVREFGLDAHVRFLGEVTPAELAACYATSSAFLCTSEHEGFCVPLVEAMAFGLPIVALATSAVPETVGDAGLVWEERDPRRFAIAVKRLLDGPAERGGLAAAGRARYAGNFADEHITARLLGYLDPR